MKSYQSLWVRWLMTVCLWWTTVPALGNEAPFEQLEKDYPLLMDKFGDELKAQRANYVFAIDVSGTMYRYEPIVVPAMLQFVESLAEGDNVNIIRFGTEAKVSLGGFSDVNRETRDALKQYIRTLYRKDADLYAYTDLHRLLDQLNRQLQIQKNNLTFVFVLTDFINDPAPGRPRLDDALCRTHREHLAARAVDCSLSMYALQLPVEGSNQLSLFRSAIPDTYHFEEFSITNSRALKDWFDRKKTEILLDKFRAIVQRANRPLDFAVVPRLDVDGYLELDVAWQPNRLFDELLLEQTQLTGGAFRVDADGDWPLLVDDALEKGEEAGRIRHTALGFHRLNHTLQVLVSLPVPFDNELQKLEIDKPRPVAEAGVSGWVFTFPLPLWLCALLVAMALVYLVLVCRAAARNHSLRWRLNGLLAVEYRGREITQYEMLGEQEVGVGCLGPVTVSGYGCNWQLRLYQQTCSCWKCWKKPRYKVTMEQGSDFLTANGFYYAGDITGISKGDFVEVGDFRVTWS